MSSSSEVSLALPPPSTEATTLLPWHLEERKPLSRSLWLCAIGTPIAILLSICLMFASELWSSTSASDTMEPITPQTPIAHAASLALHGIATLNAAPSLENITARTPVAHAASLALHGVALNAAPSPRSTVSITNIQPRRDAKGDVLNARDGTTRGGPHLDRL